VDTSTLEADAVVTSGYKWLGGHGGVALAVVSESLLKQLPILPGWMGAPDPFDLDAKSVSFASDARRFTQSTMSYVSFAGLTVSIEQLLSLGEYRIEAHARQLAAMLVDGAREYGWEPFHDVHGVAASPHIISLGHGRKRARETVEKLRDQRIICSARGDADLALDGAAQEFDGGLVGGALVGLDGLFDGVELDHHGSLLQSGFVGACRSAAGKHGSAAGLNHRGRDLGIFHQHCGIPD